MTSPTARANAARRKPPAVMLAIATPVHVAVHPAFVSALLDTQKLGQDLGVDLFWFRSHGDSLVPRARNQLAAYCLAEPRVSHILWIDADISWHPADVFRLLAHDLDFAVGLYPLKTNSIAEPVKRFVFGRLSGPINLDDDRGLFEIKCAGTGFMMTKRVVYERMMAAYPDSRITRADGVSDNHRKAMPYLHNFFPVEVVDGFLEPEDYSFCRRWRAIGGQVWADPTIKLTHHGEYAYQTDPLNMFDLSAGHAA